MFYTNANGLFNKLDELRNCIEIYDNIDIICITETHLTPEILDSELHIEGFRFCRKDRDFNIAKDSDLNCFDNSGGGGSIIYYSEKLVVHPDVKFNKNAPDSVAIKIDTVYGVIEVACIYRSMNLSKNLNKKLISCIEDISNINNDFETFIVGDFNLPDISWENCTLKGVMTTRNKNLLQQLEFADTFSRLGLKWYLVNETTRQRLVKGVLQESLLDQVLYTNEALVTNVSFLSRLGKSDHVSFNVALGISLFREEVSTASNVIRKSCWSKISERDLLTYSLTGLCAHRSINKFRGIDR